MALGVEVASLHAVLGLDKSQFDSGLQSVDKKLMGMDVSMSGLKDKWSAFGQAAQMAAIPIGLALGKGISDAMNYDSALQQISARTGTYGAALDEVSKKAMDMGAATTFSSQDALQGMLELMSSGDSVEQAMARIGDVMTMATVGTIDLKTAADGLTDVMAALGVDAEYSGDVVSEMFRATASSSADMQTMIDGMSAAGQQANIMNISARDVAATLAVFAESGIKGSEAGNKMRIMLQNMTRPTNTVNEAWKDLGTSMYTAEGKTKDFNTVLLDIQKGLDGKSEKEQSRILVDLAGSYGSTALMALMASDGIGTMRTTMISQQDATDVAQAGMHTFEGEVNSLMGSINNLNIAAFTPFMNDVLKPIVVQFKDVINQVTAFALENPELTTSIVSVGAAFVGGTAAISAFGVVANLVTTGVTALVATALSPLGAVLIVGTGLVAAYLNNWGGFRDTVDNVIRPALDSALVGFKALQGAYADFNTIVDGVVKGRWTIGDAVTAAGKAITNEFGLKAPAPSSTSNSMPFNSGSKITDNYGNPISPLYAGMQPAHVTIGSGSSGAQVIKQSVNQSKPYADGGDFNAGQPMLVGEQGPELVQFGQSGSVTPNGKMGGMVINVYGAGSNGYSIGRDIHAELVRQGVR